MGKMVTLIGPSVFDPVKYLMPRSFSETFQSETYSMFKQIFLLNALFAIVCFDVTVW